MNILKADEIAVALLEQSLSAGPIDTRGKALAVTVHAAGPEAPGLSPEDPEIEALEGFGVEQTRGVHFELGDADIPGIQIVVT